jgi:acyl carrier protein
MTQAVGRQREQQWRSQGLSPIKSEQSLKALAYASGQNMTQAGIMRVDWDRFSERLNSRQKLFFAPVFEQPADRAEPVQATAPVYADLRGQLKELPENLRREFLLLKVQDLVARVLGSEANEVLSPLRPLSELGMDSLMSVELRNLLVKSTELSLPTTLLFEAPTISAITDYLLREYNLPGNNDPDYQPVADSIDESLLLQVLDEIEGLSEVETQDELTRLSETLLSPELEAGTEG